MPDCQIPKFTENTHKIAPKISKNCLREGGWRKRGEDVRMGEIAPRFWGIDAPAVAVGVGLRVRDCILLRMRILNQNLRTDADQKLENPHVCGSDAAASDRETNACTRSAIFVTRIVSK